MSAAAAEILMPAPTAATDMRCFTVIVDGRRYGLPVDAIQTVFEITAVTPVPLAPKEVLGLVNLRGKIATAISLRRRLGLQRRTQESSGLAVGLDYQGESFALTIDEVGDVLTLGAQTEIDIPPHLGMDGMKFSSVHRLEKEILPVLDLGWVLAFGPQDKHQVRAEAPHGTER